MSFSLGSLAGGIASGYTTEQQLAMQKALQAQASAADTAAGNALGGTSAPLTQPNPLQALLGKLTGQPAQPQQPQPTQSPGGAPMGGGLVPQMGGGAPAPRPQPGATPQPPAQPTQGQPQPQQGGQPMGQLTLDNVVSRIKQSNPNISPRDLMGAVGKILPIMNAQSQQQYKMIMEQLAPARLEVQREGVDERVRHDKESEKLGGERVDQGQQRIDNQMTQFKERQAAISERFDKTLQEKYDALQSTKDRAQAAQLAQDARAAIKEKYATTRAEISAANSLDADHKDALMKEAAADRDAATARLDSALAAQRAFAAQNAEAPDAGRTRNPDGSKIDAKATPSTRPAGSPPASPDGGPVKVTTPEEAAKLKPGTHYITPDGQEYTR